MFSHRSEYSSHRRPDADRASGQRDECKDRWDNRPQNQSNFQWESCHRTREDGPSSTDRRSRSQEFSDSPGRRSSRYSTNREPERRSSRRRRGSSPVLDAPAKRRWTCAEDTDFRYQRKSFEDFKYTPPRVDHFQLRRTPPAVRSEHRRGEGSSDRSFSDGFSDEDYPKPRRDSSWERTRSPDCFTKKYHNPREKMGSPPTSVHYEDYQNRSSRQSSEGDAAPQSSSAPVKKLSTGFQRFLDVLNRGVDVDALTKIVSQTSTDVCDQYISQSSAANTADCSWLPGCPERRQKPEQHKSSCSGSTRSELLASPPPLRRSSGPNRTPASDDNVPQTSDGRSSKSPSVEKITLTPEDEEKRKQMQDVLQAIGVDLGFEELGQMTHRIQERLYGKKNDDHGQKVNQERSTKLSLRHRTGSSSSSESSFSPSSRDRYETKDPCRPARCLTELKQSTEYEQKMSSSSSQDSKTTAAMEASAPTQTLTQPPPVPVPPPITSPPLPYPQHFPGLPPGPPPPFSPGAPPPFSPHAPPPFSPGVLPPFSLGLPPRPPSCFTPRPPPRFPPGPPHLLPPGPRPPLFAPRISSGAFRPSLLPNPLLCNIFPPCLGQTRHLIPPPTHPFVCPPARVLNTPQNQNKSPGYEMNRCLLVVNTNQSNELCVKKT